MGERIRQRRVEIGMTQVALADVVGVKQQSVQKWESGVNTPSSRSLERIAGALRTSMEALMGASEPIELAASGVNLEELRQVDPEAYEAIVRQAEIALDRARRRRQG